jgi:prolyl oligopeptidase
MVTTSPASFSDCEVVRETATSKDGTKVPLSILRRKGTKLDGSNPTLLTGYGGFGISVTPSFWAGARVWLDQGGVFAVANLRGGGEFGESWHQQGMLTRKQNVFDDFAACAKYLIDAGYTKPAKLAIEGGSNGGLLMGAMITQHPDLIRAVVAYVGLFDMLRFERFPNGQFNVTEYGSVSNEEQFKALHAYSPYQHVVNGTRYPACMFLTGANDPRVDPANSRKMVARLQAATSPGSPVLLRTTSSTGHIGTPLDERIAEDADVYAFLFHELGGTYTPIPPAKPGM